MEIKWLEDFVSLAETRSFSRSAELRHITQPAFSRRIQALEAWLGNELIDRSVYPTRLTEAGHVFHPQALALLSQAREARALLRGQRQASVATLELAVPHTLSFTYIPAWLKRIHACLAQRPEAAPGAPGAAAPAEVAGPALRARLRALNVHDAVMTLAQGGCDLVISYHHPSQPVALDPARYDVMVLGKERVAPFSAPRQPGAQSARHAFPGTPNAPVPYLAYSPDAYLFRMTEAIFADGGKRLYLNEVYETDMAEGLKVMAIAGHGAAFLPLSAAADALEAGTLVALDDPLAPEFTLEMEIRLYRDKLPAERDNAHEALVASVWRAAREVANMDAKVARPRP